MDAHLAASRALGDRADLFASHHIHRFALWFESSVRADVERATHRRPPSDPQPAMRAVVWMLAEVDAGGIALRDREQYNALITELGITPQARRHHPFFQWSLLDPVPDFDARNTFGVIPGTRATREETRSVVGGT